MVTDGGFTLHIENDESRTLKVELRWPTDITQYMAIGQLSIFYRLQEGSKSSISKQQCHN